MSSLPQRPQLLSFLEASAIASLPTLMFMSGSPRWSFFTARACVEKQAAKSVILRRAPVFHQAGWAAFNMVGGFSCIEN
jgi:hypothetical protein